MSMIIIALIAALGISVILNCYLASALERESRRNEELFRENEELLDENRALRAHDIWQRTQIDFMMSGDVSNTEVPK